MSLNDEDIKLLFLLSGSCDVLPSSCIKLKSYLNLHISNLADQYNLKLLKSFRNRNKTCPYCYSPWSVETATFKLLPSQKVKAKVQNETTGSDKPLLKESRNTLILRCKVCTKKSSFSLVKKKLVKEPVQEENVKVTKKKKKKDKTCGLAVNLLKPPTEMQSSEIKSEVPFLKRKKKKKRSKDSELGNSRSAQSSSHKPVPISSKNNTKKLIPNPFAIQTGISKKNNKKLEKLKQAVKEEKGVVKKSLKDFLTLV